MATERVTITMPGELVAEIDRRARNRSKFILDAVRVELERQRREDLRVSLRTPHGESDAVADAGLDDWAAGLPEDSTDALVDPHGGREINWRSREGWSIRRRD